MCNTLHFDHQRASLGSGGTYARPLGEIIRFSLNTIFGLFCDGDLEPGIVAALFLINSTETIDNTAPAGWWSYLVHYLR